MEVIYSLVVRFKNGYKKVIFSSKNYEHVKEYREFIEYTINNGFYEENNIDNIPNDIPIEVYYDTLIQKR